MRSFELVGLDILAEIKHEKKGETEDIIPYHSGHSIQISRW
jgi:hypothetical protein